MVEIKKNEICDHTLITIVVPVYKVPQEMLRRCLDSICAQTVKNFEVLIIDDGSPDDCGKICDEYSAQYDYMKTIHQPNGGLSVVRNKGIDNASGQWICFVDGDDWIEPQSMEFAAKYIETCGDGDVLIWEEIIDTNGVLKYNCFFEKPVEGIRCFQGEEKEIVIDNFFPRYYGPLQGEKYTDIGSTLGRLYNLDFLRKENLRNVPGLKRMQDNIFNLWVFDSADKIYYQTKHLYHYCYNPESATKKHSPDFVNTLLFLFENYRKFILERRSGDESDDYFQRLYVKYISLFGQLFLLDYGSSANKESLAQKRKRIKRDFSEPEFREVLTKVDIRGQRFKAKALHFLLKNRMYMLTLIMSHVNERIKPDKRSK